MYFLSSFKSSTSETFCSLLAKIPTGYISILGKFTPALVLMSRIIQIKSSVDCIKVSVSVTKMSIEVTSAASFLRRCKAITVKST